MKHTHLFKLDKSVIGTGILFLCLICFLCAPLTVFAQDIPPIPGLPPSDDGGDGEEGDSCVADKFQEHKDWLVDVFAIEHIIPTLQAFTEQMTSVAMHQTMIIGTFFDAKHQLETQRLFQELQLEAHKDYQPSAGLCAFGTNVRSLAHSESVGRYNAQAMGQRQLARHLGTLNMAGSKIAQDDKASRWEQFVVTYCDPQDNDWTLSAGTGLIPGTICKNSAANANRTNIDIDYTRAIENRRTLDISRPIDLGSNDEVDTQALGNNLYGNNVLFRSISPEVLADDKTDKPKLYMQLRAIAAKRNVAENSFNSIVGMKSLGSSPGLNAPNTVETHKFLGAVLTELGIPEDEVSEYLGLEPLTTAGGTQTPPSFSYYAQLEILSKKIFQNPDFYANLYDKPANVKRISAALMAIELMLDRAIYESQLRQEMSMSVLLSARLKGNFADINKNLNE